MGENASPSNVMRFLVGGSAPEPVAAPRKYAVEGEAFRRVAEWERQIECLDQKEMELHQTQMKLVREQTATFIRDLSHVRQEVAALKLRQDATDAEFIAAWDVTHKENKERHDSMHGRLLQFEREFPILKGELTEIKLLVRDKLHQEIDKKLAMHKRATEELVMRHTDNVEDSMRKLDLHHGRLKGRVDNLLKDVEVMVSKHVSNLDSQVNELRAALGPDPPASAKLLTDVQDRVSYLEKLVGDSAEKSQRDLDAAHRQLEQLHGRVAEHQTHLARHATVQERVDYLEKMLGDSADQHVAMKAAHDQHIVTFRKHAEDLEALKPLAGHHVTLSERLSHLEGHHGQELATAHDKLETLHGRVSAVEEHGASIADLQRKHKALVSDRLSIDSKHASMTGRMDYLEQAIGDSADKHAEELQQLKQAHATHAKELEDVRSSSMHRSTIEERLQYLEQVIGDSTEKHTTALAAAHKKLDEIHGTQTSHSSKLEGFHASLTERVDSLEQQFGDVSEKHGQALEAASDKHATVAERLEYLEAQLGDSAGKHTKELESLKAAHDEHLGKFSKHAEDVEALKAASGQHATVADRLNYLEQCMGDSAGQHAEELRALRESHDQLHGKLAEEREKFEQQQLSLREELAKEAEQRAGHHASLNERVDNLETRVGDNADKHAKLADNHGSIEERLEALQRSHGESAGKLTQDLRVAHQKIDSMYARLLAVKDAWKSPPCSPAVSGAFRA